MLLSAAAQTRHENKSHKATLCAYVSTMIAQWLVMFQGKDDDAGHSRHTQGAVAHTVRGTPTRPVSAVSYTQPVHQTYPSSVVFKGTVVDQEPS